MNRLWVLFVVAAAASAQVPSIDWEKNKAEVLQHYRALIQIESTAGNETRVVEYLKKVLEAEGIATRTFALDPSRANVVARLRGNGSKSPLLILAHTDVVGVQREKWPVDPFGAIMKEGYIWGRGSKDDKPVLAANLMTMLLLKRNNVRLDRDVIFLAESGEEADTTGVGINFMVSQHFDEIDAEFALTEGGGAKIEGDRVTVVNIGTAEKVPARGERNFRSWLCAAAGQRDYSPERRDQQARQVGNAHAPQRNDAGILRKDGCHLFAGGCRCLQGDP
jgi:acetylornithine deacetylase/succinyl-diaminopimelate desuccinylase-like protein